MLIASCNCVYRIFAISARMICRILSHVWCKRWFNQTMLIFAYNRCERLPHILTPVLCEPCLPDLHHIRLHNPVPVLSGYGRHRLSDIIRSTLTAMITLNDKRLWIIQNEFYKSSGYPVHRLLCQWSYCPDAVFLLDFFRSIEDTWTGQ